MCIVNPHHRVIELSNGTRLTLVRLPAVHSVAVAVYLTTGSRFENPTTNGLSHFLEHMLYRGTKRHPSAHSQALAFERLGSTLEASTSVDHGTLSLSVPSGNLEDVLGLLCEAYREPLLQEIETEKGIVREEILESLDEHGRLVDADELVRQLCFSDHPLGYPITGTLDQVSGFTREMAAQHHSERYVGGGTVVAVAGPVEADCVATWLDDGLREVPSGQPPTGSAPEPLAGPAWRYVRHTSSQTALRLAFRGPGDQHEDEPALDLLLRIIDDGLSTRLYHRVCDELGLCYDVAASYEAYSDCGVIEFAADTANEHAAEVLRELLGVISQLRDDGPTDEEVSKAVARHGWQLAEMLDDPAAIADFYALGELTGVARTLEERHAAVVQVSPEQLRRVARRWLVPAGLSVIAVGVQSRAAQNELASTVRSFG